MDRGILVLAGLELVDAGEEICDSVLRKRTDEPSPPDDRIDEFVGPPDGDVDTRLKLEDELPDQCSILLGETAGDQALFDLSI